MLVTNLRDFEQLYTIDEEGSIRSKKTGNAVAQQINSAGYCVSQIYKNNKRYVVKIHRAVIKSFIGDPDKRCVIAHRDGNKYNNSLSNLLITSPYVNNQHKKEHGTVRKGENHWNCVLSDAAVDFIRNKEHGMNNSQLATLFSCSDSHVRNIIAGRTRS